MVTPAEFADFATAFVGSKLPNASVPPVMVHVALTVALTPRFAVAATATPAIDTIPAAVIIANTFFMLCYLLLFGPECKMLMNI
jgi:hypothetical protein